MNQPPNASQWSDPDFDTRLQQLLDERRDPLDDPQLVAWLDAHPERLAAFAALRDDLLRLDPQLADAQTQPQQLRTAAMPRRMRLVAVAAAAAAAALLFVFARREPERSGGSTSPTQTTPSPQLVANRSPGRVLTAHLEGHSPRLYAAAEFTLHESLWQTPRLDFTTSHRIHVTR